LVSLALWGRGLAIFRAFAHVRKFDCGKLLANMPAHLEQMAKNTVSYAAMMHLGFFIVTLLGISEQPASFSTGRPRAADMFVEDLDEVAALLRLLKAVMKAQCSKLAIYGLQECMESLGGVGYLEDEQEFNVARLYRDCNVNSIWEGTTDVMATDVIRVMRGQDRQKILLALKRWVERAVQR
jgi:alkylation response protein AidB-like acyl-CoA dehydrogenase